MTNRSFYYPHNRADTWETGEVLDPRTGELVREPSRTKQSFVAECDINNILKQYKLTGQIRHISAKAAQGSYVDLPEPQDFQEAMNTVIAAEDSFATLPSHVRARFGNDPSQFLGFMADPANAEEMIRLGLATKPTPPPSPPPSPPPTPSDGQKNGVPDPVK